MNRRALFPVLLTVGLALTAAACGRKGPLEPPPGGKDIPGEDNAQPSDREEQAGLMNNPIGQRPRRPPPIKPPNDPFVLDAIL